MFSNPKRWVLKRQKLEKMIDGLRAELERALASEGSGSSDFDLNPDVVLPKNRVLKPAAVLIAIRNDTQSLILTKRSANLKNHPGQIAFPGGKKDPGDSDLIVTALREASEEIALPNDHVEVLGTLPTHETVTGYAVTPVVGLVANQKTLTPELDEVEEIFEIPFAHVLKTKHYATQSRRWQGRMRYYQTVPYGPYYIWGATARMLFGLAKRFQQ